MLRLLRTEWDGKDVFSWVGRGNDGVVRKIESQRVEDSEEIIGVKRVMSGVNVYPLCGNCHQYAMVSYNCTAEDGCVPEKLFLQARVVYCTSCAASFVELWRDGRTLSYFANVKSWYPPVALTGEEIFALDWHGNCVVGVMNKAAYKAAYYGVKNCRGWIAGQWGVDSQTLKILTHPLVEGQVRLDYYPVKRHGEQIILTDHTVMLPPFRGEGDLMMMGWVRRDYSRMERQAFRATSLRDYVHSNFGSRLNALEERMFVDFPLFFSHTAEGFHHGISSEEFRALVDEHVWRFPFFPTLRNAAEVRAEIEKVLASACGKGKVALKGIWG
jgi:hypothetical protein